MVEPSTEALARRGIFALVLRQVLGMVIRTPLLIVMVRLLGPASYGQYAAAATLMSFLIAPCGLGTDIFLIRSSDAPAVESEQRIFSLLLGSSTAISVAGLLTSFLVESEGNRAFLVILRLALLTLPINVLWIPSMARLERAMKFRQLGVIELMGDIVFFATALPLIGWAKSGPVGAIAGIATQQIWLLIATSSASGFVPKLRRPNSETKAAVAFGFPLVLSAWVLQLRELANPLIVGISGTDAEMGRVALAQRLTTTVLFARQPTTRVAAVALSRVQHDVGELQRTHAVGTQLLTAAASISLAVFALMSPWVIPAAFGQGFESTGEVFSLISGGLIFQSLFGLHGQALNFFGEGMRLLRIRLIQSGTTLLVAFILVPRIGILGLGVAEVVRSLTFVMVHVTARRHFRPNYRPALLWVVASVPWLCIPFLGHGAAAGCAAAAGAVLFSVAIGRQARPLIDLFQNQRTPNLN